MADPQEKLTAGPPPKWSEIVADPAFIELPGEQKESFRQGYRDKILKPMIAPQNWPSAASEFDKDTKSTTVAGPVDYIGSKLWKGLTFNQATFGPDMVELLFMPKPEAKQTHRVRVVDKSFGEVGGGMSVYRPSIRKEERNVSTGADVMEPARESFARYRKMVAEALGTGNQKAAPGPVTKFAGEAAEVLGSGGPLSLKNVVTRAGTVGKSMQAGREVLSSTGAAGGMELAKSFGEHMMPDNPMARTFAIMAGGVLGGGALEMAIPTTLEMAWYRGKELTKRADAMVSDLVADGMPLDKARAAAKLMTTEIEQFRNSALGKEFSKALSSQPNAAIFAKEAKEAADKIADFKPNMAMTTGSSAIADAGIAAAKRSDYVAMSIATSQAQALRALNLYGESMITSGSKTAKQVVDEITKSDLYKATKELEANQGKWTELHERLTSGDFFTKQDGEALIALRNSAAQSVQKSFEAQYKGLYKMADEAGFKMNLGDFYSDILKIEAAPGNVATRMPATYGFLKNRINKLSDVDKKKGEIADLQDRMSRSDGKQASLLQNRIRSLRQEIQGAEGAAAVVPATFEEAHSFYKAINDDLYNATLSANDARLLKGVKDDMIGRMKASNEGVYSIFDDINKTYKANYTDVFRKGAAGRMVNETKFGLQTPEQDALKSYIGRGAQGRDEFKRVYGNDETAGQLVEQGIADTFASYVKDKQLTPDLVKRFVAQHKDFLEGFPNVQKSFSSIETAAATLEKRADELAATKNNILTAQVKTLLNSTEPEKVLLQNVKSQDFMNRIQTMSKQNPEAAQAFAYEYGEILKNMDPAKASQFLIDHQKELKPIFDAFDPKLYDKLATLSLGKQVYERGWSKAQYGMKIEPDAMKRAIGIDTPGFWNKMWALSAGKVGNVWNTLYVGSKFFGAKKLERWDHVIGDAFTNPAFVDKLITEQYGPLVQEAQRMGISIEELVKRAGENPQLAESLKTTLTDVASKGKAALDAAKLGHSFQAHGYRVVVSGAQKGTESLERQEGIEEGSPYWNPQDLRLRRMIDTAKPGVAQ
jgi:hypothetical protein